MSPDELSRLFQAERAVQPHAEGLERGLSRLLTDVARRAVPLPVAAGSLKLGLSVVSKWLIAGFVVGLGGAGAASQLYSAARQPSAALHPSVVATAQAAEIAPPPAPVPAKPIAKSPAESQARALSSGPSAPPLTAASGPSAATFDEELRLIAAARSELERGRAHAALPWLGEHAQRFPRGVFALERQALEVLVACNEKKQPGLAQAFAAKHPQSALAARLFRACDPHEAATPSRLDFSEIDK